MISLAEMTVRAIQIKPAEIILIVSGIILTLCILGFLIFVFTRRDTRAEDSNRTDLQSDDDGTSSRNG